MQEKLLEEARKKGADWWAFRKPVRPAVPSVAAKNPIDAFLLRRLREKGLGFAPEAGKPSLLRRLAYDLTGLPPTPEEVRLFLADDSPSAYEDRVEHYLASPRYGERWGRYWLDVGRCRNDLFLGPGVRRARR